MCIEVKHKYTIHTFSTIHAFPFNFHKIHVLSFMKYMILEKYTIPRMYSKRFKTIAYKSVYWEIRTKMRNFVCLMCTHPILSKNIFWHHGSYFGAAYARAHAARDFVIRQKKKYCKNDPNFIKFWKKMFFVTWHH